MGRGSYLGGSTILRGARGALALLPSQRRPGKKKTPMATDSWASATHGGGPAKSIKPPKAKKSTVGRTDLTAETVEERRARRNAAIQERRAADMNRLAEIQVVTKRGNRILSESTLADRATDVDPAP